MQWYKTSHSVKDWHITSICHLTQNLMPLQDPPLAICIMYFMCCFFLVFSSDVQTSTKASPTPGVHTANLFPSSTSTTHWREQGVHVGQLHHAHALPPGGEVGSRSLWECTSLHPRHQGEGIYLAWVSHAALLWQKETSDIPSKSELLMFQIIPHVLLHA